MSKAKIANSMFPGFPKSRLLKQAARINKIHGSAETAYKFNPTYTKFDLILAQERTHKPSIGLRQFWKHNLPTLKFHNYDTEFHVYKVQTQSPEELAKCPVKIVIHQGDNQTLLNCEAYENSEILTKLVELTGATPVPAEELKLLDL